jgi:phosphoribosyl 1,2-cyclic phosphodiesterase
MESNHDEDMLRAAKRPWSLKQRISGRQGHLSNRQAGELIAELRGPCLQAVLLAHLSADCNTPDLAVAEARSAAATAGVEGVRIEPTFADRASVLVELG